MDQDKRAIHKLIILAILDQAKGVTVNQLTALALETLYMDYFAFRKAYDELIRDHLATEAVRKGEVLADAAGRPIARCDITAQGLSILDTLESRIPLPVKSYLTSALSGWRKDQLRESTVTADFSPDANGFFLVRLGQHDGRKETIDLRLTVPNETVARRLCANWRQFPQTLYMGLLTLLTNGPDSNLDPQDKKQEQPPAEGLDPSTGQGAPAFDDRQLDLHGQDQS